jgi:hypothetical protein
MIDFDAEQEIQPQEGFTIDDPGKANWAVETILAERARRDLYIKAAQAKIEELQSKIRAVEDTCNMRTQFLLASLDRYLDTVPAKTAKTQISLDLPAGKLVRKLPGKAMTHDPNKLLSYAKQYAPEFVQVKESAQWGELKKRFTISGELVVDKTTGAVVDAVTVTDTPGSFDIK